jgi:CRP/FNR family transcriptional regulator
LREVGQRVAKVLLDEGSSHGKRTDGTIAFRQQLTHVQLAARIGTVREVVTRALTRLQNQGLIRLDGKNIILLDETALRQYAES